MTKQKTFDEFLSLNTIARSKKLMLGYKITRQK